MYYEVSDQSFMAILWKHYKCFLTDLLVIPYLLRQLLLMAQ